MFKLGAYPSKENIMKVAITIFFSLLVLLSALLSISSLHGKRGAPASETLLAPPDPTSEIDTTITTSLAITKTPTETYPQVGTVPPVAIVHNRVDEEQLNIPIIKKLEQADDKSVWEPSLPGALIIKTGSGDPLPQSNAMQVDSVLPIEDSGSNQPLHALDANGVRERTNFERGKNGQLAPLNRNQQLTLAAEEKARDLIEKQYFAHVSPTGVDISDLARTYSYSYLSIGENLALGNFLSNEHVVTAWMNSPGHRANILNADYTEIGIATIEGFYEGEKVWFAVQEFGRPLSDCPSPDPLLQKKIEIYTSQLTSLEKTLNNLSAEIAMSNLDVATHNQKAKDYNTIVALYNDLVETTKLTVSDFNTQASKFNLCISE